MTTFFPKATLDEIRNRAGIVEIISDYVSLKKVGRNHQGLCPFHNEKTPSFSVSEEKQVFYCFGCQKGGDVITFFKEVNNLSFVEAVSQLAQRYGVMVPKFPREREKGRVDREVLIRVNERALAYFHSQLMERPSGKIGRQYLEERRISPEMQRAFSLGYAPDQWDGLTSFLTSENVSLQLAKTVGLVSPRKGGGFFDYFRGRIIFPILDYSGKPIGFGGRALKGASPKYLNSPDSAIYKKSYSVFGLPITRDAIVENGMVLIVEGYFDLLSLYQSGIRSVVSPLGTALTQGHIQVLKRYSTNFYLLFDADEAGEKALIRSLTLFLDEGLSPRVVIMPKGSDPDDVINDKGPNFFREKIAESPFLIDYFVDKMIARHDYSRAEGKSTVIREIMPILNRIGDPIVKSENIRVLAEKLGVREDHVRRFVRGSPISKDLNEFTSAQEDRRETFLIAMVMRYPDFIPVLEKTGVIADLNNPDLRALGSALVDMFRKDNSADVAGLLAGLSEEQRNLASALTVKDDYFGDVEASLRDCVRQIKRLKIKRMKRQLTQRIKLAQERRNDAEIRELNRQKTHLIMKEKNLNSPNWILEEAGSL